MSRRPGRILPVLLALFALVARPAAFAADEEPRALLAGSWGQGLFRLAPGDGSKWEAYGGELPQKFVTFVSLDSKGTLYCGFDLPGIWFSKDFGTTWEKTPSAPPVAPSGIVAHPANPDILLVTTWGKGAWWTEDGGKTWTGSDSPSQFMRKPIVVSDGERPRFLAIVDDGRIFSCRGVRGDWTPVARIPRGLKAWDLAARDGAGRKLLVATEAGVAEVSGGGEVTFPRLEVPSAFARSVVVDGERTLIGTWGYGVIEWTSKGARFLNSELANRNIFALALISGEAVGKAEAASDTGPATWTSRSSGLQNLGISCITADPSNEKTLYASTGGGIHKSTDGGKSWALSSAGITDQGTGEVVVDPTNPATLYTNAGSNAIFKSTDGGSSWTKAVKGLNAQSIQYLGIDPLNPKVLYINSWGDGVYRSEDGAENWKSFSDGLSNVNGYCVVAGKTKPADTFAGMDTIGIMKLVNGKWVDANSGMTMPYVWHLAQDPFNGANWIAGTAGGGAFKTTDSGKTWKEANKGLTSPNANRIAFHPTKPGRAYIGTSGAGLFVSNDNGDTWTQDNGGLNDLKVSAICITPTGLVYLGTGNGIYVRQD